MWFKKTIVKRIEALELKLEQSQCPHLATQFTYSPLFHHMREECEFCKKTLRYFLDLDEFERAKLKSAKDYLDRHEVEYE